MGYRQQKVPTAELKQGMYVAELDRPWLGTPYQLQGFMIRNQQDIERLQQYSSFVFIDIDRSKLAQQDYDSISRQLNEDEKIFQLTGKKPRHYDITSNFDDEMSVALENVKKLSQAAENIMQDVVSNKQIKLPELKKAVDPMVESIIRNPQALSWLNRMRLTDNYTYNHSVSAAILASAFGRNLGLPRKDLQSLAMGAILFDIGKMKLPEKLLSNPNRFNKFEIKLIQKHVDHSLEIASSIQGINKDVIAMIATHHERHNGSGYPKGLQGDQIPLFGKMAGIIDSYDALISERVFVSAISPTEAIGKLYQWNDIDFQAELIEQFINLVGIFPVGTIVELSDKRIGVVMAHHRLWRLRPKIMLLLDSNKKPLRKYEIIDLYNTEIDENGQLLSISKSIDPGVYGIDPDEFYL